MNIVIRTFLSNSQCLHKLFSFASSGSLGYLYLNLFQIGFGANTPFEDIFEGSDDDNADGVVQDVDDIDDDRCSQISSRNKYQRRKYRSSFLSIHPLTFFQHYQRLSLFPSKKTQSQKKLHS